MFKNIFKKIEEMNDRLQYGEDVTEAEVDNFIGIFAVLYVTAYADGICKSEMEVISLFKFNMIRALNRPNRENLRDVFYSQARELDQVEKLSDTLKLSDALEYFPDHENGISDEIKDILKNLIADLIEADGVVSKEELRVQERLALYCEKGPVAIKEIQEMEANDE